MYTRLLKKPIEKKMFEGKALIIVGARQTGKTTLILDVIRDLGDEKYKIFNCDNPTEREVLANKNLEFLKQLIGSPKIVVIDEAQKVENIGQTLKLLVDFYKKEKQLLVTGSSSINLLDSVSEPLTGRKLVYSLFPLSLEEIYGSKDYLDLIKNLDSLLIFGSYPEVVTRPSFEDKTELLREICSSYLYKDVFEFQKIKNSNVVTNLLKALALQIGSEVSYNELSNLLGIDKKTVENYIDLLEKNFVIFRLSPYSKNKRREISKLRKIYFYDVGIRNALINNFNFLDSRNDTGALWENFIISERLKYRNYHKIYADQYFWRTYDGSEVDLVEEIGGKLYGYEFKFAKSKRVLTPPVKWLEYKSASYTEINRENLDGFVI